MRYSHAGMPNNAKKKYSEKKPGNKIQIKTWGPKMEISFQKCPVLAKLSSP